jgi:hypothetical protein
MADKVYTLIYNLDHDKDVAVALGNMVVAWSYAETMLVDCLVKITKMSPRMAQMGYYRIPTFESRTKFIVSIIHHWKATKKRKDEVEKAIEKLAKLSATRNKWMHNRWAKEKDGNGCVIFDYRNLPETKGRRAEVKAHDINLHCETVILRAGLLRYALDPK